MNPTQRQQPTREQVIQHLKGQIVMRELSLDLTQRKRAVCEEKMKLAAMVYSPFTDAPRDERKRELLRYEIALEEGKIESGYLDMQIADMKGQLEQLKMGLAQTESNIIAPTSQGVSFQ